MRIRYLRSFTVATGNLYTSDFSCHQKKELRPGELGGQATDSSSPISLPGYVSWRSYTRAFGDGPRNFEPWSSDEDDT
ncbi:hypothetical protein TNCV_2892261 [Trichonephila clavipes]|nr:hypothetical protein TNCV_2892261 [Trichonephila clavipes]